MASTYYHQGKYGDTEALYSQTLEIQHRDDNTAGVHVKLDKASEKPFHRKLHYTRRKADVGGGDLSEAGGVGGNTGRAVPHGPSTDNVVGQREVGSVRDVIRLGTERQSVLLTELEVLEQRKIEAFPRD